MSIINWQRNPFTGTNNAVTTYELHQIPTSAPYIVQLEGVPEYNLTTTTKAYYLSNNTQLTEKYSAPASSEFWVDYQPQKGVSDIENREGTSKVLFNSADSGKYVIIEYNKIGNIKLAENEIVKFRTYPGLSQVLPSAANTPLKVIYYEGIYYIVYSVDSTNNECAVRYYGTNLVAAGNISAISNNSTSSITFGFDRDSRCHIHEYDGYLYIWAHSIANNSYLVKTDLQLNIGDLSDFVDTGLELKFIQFAASIKIGQYIYFFGANSANDTADNLAYRFDFVAGSYATLEDLPNNWQYGCAVSDGGKYIYLIGNMAAGEVGQVLRYDIIADTYTEMPIGAPSYVINESGFYDGNANKIIFAVGTTGMTINGGVYEYDIDNNTFATVIRESFGAESSSVALTQDAYKITSGSKINSELLLPGSSTSTTASYILAVR